MFTSVPVLREISMIRTTRTVVVASLALAALTGCGGAAAEARGTHTYEPLPPLSTATPTTSPAPQPTSPAAPTSSPAPTAGASAGPAAPAGGTAEVAASVAAPAGGTEGTSIPGQAPAAGSSFALGQAPAAAAGPVGGGTPVQATERTSTSTTTTTSTTIEVGLTLVVTCEGLCVLDDLSAPQFAGQDGPFSPDLLRQALEEELAQQGGDQRLTDELVEQLMQDQWSLAERDLVGGDEKLIFSSARK
ncbi:hypothetical protein [Kocuria sp. NPDC057446]|uniref:hypothetical protein n=1 Tax=Kocuria sp. NPDC057446 TaxID=3346137 RepID=UPI00368B61AF